MQVYQQVAAAVAATLLFCKAFLGFKPLKPSLAVYEATKKPRATRAKARQVCITGGNGFLGRRIVQSLLADESLNVKVVVFDALPPKQKDERIKYVVGDVTLPEHAMAAVEGCTDVIHTASVTPITGWPDWYMEKVNVNGNRAVLGAATASGVKNFIYTSSATVVLDKNNYSLLKADIDAPYPKDNVDCYTRTKAQAEREVLEANCKNMRTVSIRPAAIFGEGDRVVCEPVLKGGVAPYIGTGDAVLDWIPVEEVAEVHRCAFLAIEDNADQVAGKAFYASLGASMTYRKFMGGELEPNGRTIWGNSRKSDSVPIWLVTCLAIIDEIILAITNLKIMPAGLTRMTIDFTQRSYTYNISQTVKCLGYVPKYKTVEEAIDALRKSQ